MYKLIILAILVSALIGCASQKPSSADTTNLFLKMDKTGSYSYEGVNLSLESFKTTLNNLSPSITDLEMEISENLNMGYLLKICDYLNNIKIKKDVYYLDGGNKKNVFCVQ